MKENLAVKFDESIVTRNKRENNNHEDVNEDPNIHLDVNSRAKVESSRKSTGNQTIIRLH